MSTSVCVHVFSVCACLCVGVCVCARACKMQYKKPK